MSDEALVSLLRDDQTSALREIFDRYHEPAYKIAFGVLRDGDVAKDLVQELFIDLWMRRHTVDIQSLRPYINTAVRFKALALLRNGKLHARHLALMDRIRFVNQTEEAINIRELDESLRQALSELAPRCKEVFELSRFENLSHKQIAGRLGITPKTVEVQIHKALMLLRKRLDKTVIVLFTTLFV